MGEKYLHEDAELPFLLETVHSAEIISGKLCIEFWAQEQAGGKSSYLIHNTCLMAQLLKGGMKLKSVVF